MRSCPRTRNFPTNRRSPTTSPVTPARWVGSPTRARLDRARKIGGPETIKQMALNDPDLEPLWEEIRKW